ncbi:MAG: branched-chain amino acid ABC transporter permease [Gemmatimonadetes bacterium]|nr:MAG: branched-chain amino acid ABC transporter permease [Gemmatimonadota bacterium]
MTLTGVVNQFISGVTFGMVLFLLALGLALIFGVLRVVNFAHGSLYMVGAFLGYFVWEWLKAMALGFWLSVVVAGLAVAALGLVLEYLLRPIYDREHSDQILFTYGFVLIIGDLVKMFWGGQYRSVPRPPGLAGRIELAGVVLPTYNLLLIGVGAATGIGLWLLLTQTRLGKVIRAAVADREMVAILGIRLPRLFATVFAIGAFLAGAAGMLAAPLGSIGSGMDVEIIVAVFAVVIVGGMGSFLGAALASLIIGEVYTFGILILPQAAQVFMFFVMVAVLIVRPQGLLGAVER